MQDRPDTPCVRPVIVAALCALTLAGCGGGGYQRPGVYGEAAKTAAEAARQRAEAERKARDLTARGLKLVDHDKVEDAVKLLRQAVETDPEFAPAWDNLGVALFHLGDRKLAMQAFSKAAELSPSDPRPLYNMGTLLQLNGYPTDAKQYYMEALGRNPDYLPALRESIRIDDITASADKDTADRIKRALMLEKDPKWRELFRRAALRIEHEQKEAEPG